MSHLDERWTTFTVGGQRVHGMLHLPKEPGPHPAVLMLHGFTGQRIEPHRLFVLFSRLLAANGIASLRFDFRGSGESEGTFDEMTVSREVEDVRHAAAHLAARPEVDPSRLGLLGLSMGGMVAALGVAEPGPGLAFRALALWAPAAPQVWLAQFPAGTTPTTMPDTLDANGHPVSRAFFLELERLRPLDTVRTHRGPALVVHGTADPTVPVAVGCSYAEALGARFHQVEGAGHTFESLPTQAEAHEVTLSFFKEAL